MTEQSTISAQARDMAARVERFVRDEIVPYEKDPRRDHHGAPTDELVYEMRAKARAAGVLTPHILPGGAHLNQRETAIVLIASGLSPLGPLACNTMAPDEGNMYLLGHKANAEQQERFLKPLVEGRARSAFFMTEPAADNGAGSDPGMMLTTCPYITTFFCGLASIFFVFLSTADTIYCYKRQCNQRRATSAARFSVKKQKTGKI